MCENKFDAQEIVDRLWLGSSHAGACSVEILQTKKISHVLVAGMGLTMPHKDEPSIHYHKINLIDHHSQSLTKHLDGCLKFIDDALAAEGSVLVHCALGVSRSASIVIAYVSKTLHLTFDEAISLVREKRPEVEPNGALLSRNTIDN